MQKFNPSGRHPKKDFTGRCVAGAFFGIESVSGLLVGGLTSGVQLAISQANTGGACSGAPRSGTLGGWGLEGFDCESPPLFVNACFVTFPNLQCEVFQSLSNFFLSKRFRASQTRDSHLHRPPHHALANSNCQGMVCQQPQISPVVRDRVCVEHTPKNSTFIISCKIHRFFISCYFVSRGPAPGIMPRSMWRRAQ